MHLNFEKKRKKKKTTTTTTTTIEKQNLNFANYYVYNILTALSQQILCDKLLFVLI